MLAVERAGLLDKERAQVVRREPDRRTSVTRPAPGRSDPLQAFRDRCKSCRADIVWATTAVTGSRMPVDPTPAAMGNVTLYIEPARRGRAAQLIATVLTLRQRQTARHVDDVTLHTSHFATCSEAGRHRTRSRTA